MNNIDDWILPYPLAIPRFITITCLLFQAWRTGIPAIGEFFSKLIGLTVLQAGQHIVVHVFVILTRWLR